MKCPTGAGRRLEIFGPEAAARRWTGYMSSKAAQGPSGEVMATTSAGAARLASRLSARLRGTAGRWLAVVLAVNVAVGMAYSVAVLRRDGDRHREIGSTMMVIEERVDLQGSLVMGASAVGDGRNEARPAAFSGGLRSLSAAIREDVAHLRRLGSTVGPDATVNLAVERHLQLVARGIDGLETGGATEETTESISESRDRLKTQLSAARESHDERASDAYRTADIESILMMGLAALMAVLLHKKFISARRLADERAARERAQGEARFRSLVQNANDVILICDLDTAITYQTPSAKAVLGFEHDELVGRRLTDLAHPNDVRRLFSFCHEIGAHPGGARTISWRMKHRDDFWIHVESAASNLIEDPSVRGLVLTLRDVSAQKSLEQQLKHQAFHDSLTNLANRALFIDRVGHALMRASRSNKDTAVLLVDIDDFKTINDSLGHSAGDDLLVEIAQRLERAVRPSDTVARLGGDEFAVLLEDIGDTSDAQMVADRVMSGLGTRVEISDRELFVHASIGIASSSTTEEGAEELLRNADVAMYMAKGAGKGMYMVFEPTMHAAALDRLELKVALERGVESGEFRLHYQPIVDLTTGEICGMEALVRWQRGDELVPPLDFIPVAEETGLIHKLGSWVLDEACRQAKKWQTLHRIDPPLGMNVNISARQVLQPALVEAVRNALSQSGLEPGTLTLEITESDLVLETEEIVGRLKELKNLGVRLAIDDFGTGYSSLSYLEKFPIDVLKIDRSFMTRLADETDRGLTHAILEIGRTLDLEVVAEGIEDDRQLAALRGLECRRGQGFLFSRPLDEETMKKLLARGLPLSTTGNVGEAEA